MERFLVSLDVGWPENQLKSRFGGPVLGYRRREAPGGDSLQRLFPGASPLALALVPRPPITTTQCGPTAGWFPFSSRRDLLWCPRGLPKVRGANPSSKQGGKILRGHLRTSSNFPVTDLVRAFAALLGTEEVVEGLDAGRPLPAQDVGPGMPPAGDGLVQDQLGSAWLACRWMSSTTAVLDACQDRHDSGSRTPHLTGLVTGAGQPGGRSPRAAVRLACARPGCDVY